MEFNFFYFSNSINNHVNRCILKEYVYWKQIRKTINGPFNCLLNWTIIYRRYLLVLRNTILSKTSYLWKFGKHFELYYQRSSKFKYLLSFKVSSNVIANQWYRSNSVTLGVIPSMITAIEIIHSKANHTWKPISAVTTLAFLTKGNQVGAKSSTREACLYESVRRTV